MIIFVRNVLYRTISKSDIDVEVRVPVAAPPLHVLPIVCLLNVQIVADYWRENWIFQYDPETKTSWL